ncbi:MAG: M28 family peptidase [Candidatus Coprovivens sp.]
MKYKDTILNKYMVRKNKKQKNEFISYVKEELKDSKYDISIEKGYFGSRNIVIGDVSKAKVLFTAHYDTCAVLPVPNFITPTNIFIYVLYQILLLFLIVFVSAFITIGISFLFPINELLLELIYDFIIILFVCLIMFGPANKSTVNDNTSGVLTILEMINKIPDNLKDKVAFILFDLEESGLIGSASFASKHKDVMKEKLLINFDCVSDGDKIMFIFNKKAIKNVDLLKDVYTSDNNVITDMITKGAIYPSDQANFTNGVGVCSVIRGKHFEYIDKIHTKKDTVCRDENINYLVDKSIKLVEKV